MQPDDTNGKESIARELLEHYLRIVEFWLPKTEGRDILAELGGEIRAQVQEQEAEFGRALDATEMEALLERWGHPVAVARRYLPRRYLIGPELFPLYRFALKGVALVYLVPWLCVWLGLLAFSPAYRAAHASWQLLDTLSSFATLAFVAFGAITLGFALLERSQARTGFLPEWNPERAPERDPLRISRAGSGAALVLHLVFLAWWVNPAALPAVDGTAARAAAVWVELHARLFVPVIAFALAGAAFAAVNWLRPWWTRARLAARAAIDGLWTALLVWTLVDFADVAARLERISAAKAAGSEAEALESVAHLGVFAVALVLGAGFAWAVVRDLLRVVRWNALRFRVVGLSFVVLLVAGLAPDLRAQSAASLPSDAEIRALLVDHIDVQKRSHGTVVGTVSPAGRRVVAHGRFGAEDPRPVGGDSVFEIGSVTKVFTALLLADMVSRGELELADPVAKHLPEGVAVREWQGRPVTLVDLATHTSALPFWPPGVAPDAKGSLSHFSVVDLYDFLAGYELPRDVGRQWEYSNLGYGLLGHALSVRAGSEYEDLVRARITAPLGMRSTAIAVSPEMQERLVAGHDKDLQPAPVWDVPTLCGAGSLHSTAEDLLTFLAACIGLVESPLVESPLAPAFARMLETERTGPSFEQALGWWVFDLGGRIVTHGGATHGFACTLAYDPGARAGVVVLSNSALDDGGLAWHLLRPSFPVATSAGAKKRAQRAEIELPPQSLERFVGVYQPASGGALTIELRERALWFVSEHAPSGIRLHAASESEFFAHEAEFEAVFERAGDARASGLTVRFAGTETRASRVESP